MTTVAARPSLATRLTALTKIVELGPGTVLAGLIRKIDRTVTVASVEDPAGLPAVTGFARAES